MVGAEWSAEKRPCGVGLRWAALLHSLELRAYPLRFGVKRQNGRYKDERSAFRSIYLGSRLHTRGAGLRPAPTRILVFFVNGRGTFELRS